MREVEQDLDEGADSVMVKPGLPYLDVVRAVRDTFNVPVFAYQVSGRVRDDRVRGAARRLRSPGAMLESLWAFKRAGASGVLSYFALEAARVMG